MCINTAYIYIMYIVHIYAYTDTYTCMDTHITWKVVTWVFISHMIVT